MYILPRKGGENSFLIYSSRLSGWGLGNSIDVRQMNKKSASFLRRFMGRTFDKYRFLISFNQKLNFVRNYSSNRKPDAFIKPLTKKLVLSELENMLINFIVFV